MKTHYYDYVFLINSSTNFISGYEATDTIKLGHKGTWERELPDGTYPDIITVLDDIFLIFNQDHPSSYMDRSMACGDVVYIDDTFWTLSSTGWKKVESPMLRSFINTNNAQFAVAD